MIKEFRGLKKSNQKGQIAIESLLLMVVLVGAFLFLTKELNDRKIVSKLVAGPIKSIGAMTGYGTWRADGCTAPGKSRVTLGKCHPNSIARSLSSDPAP